MLSQFWIFLILFSMKFEVIINKGDGSFHQNQTAVFEGSDFKIFKPRKWTSFKEGGFKLLIHFGFSWKNDPLCFIWESKKSSKSNQFYFPENDRFSGENQSGSKYMKKIDKITPSDWPK